MSNFAPNRPRCAKPAAEVLQRRAHRASLHLYGGCAIRPAALRPMGPWPQPGPRPSTSTASCYRNRCVTGVVSRKASQQVAALKGTWSAWSTMDYDNRNKNRRRKRTTTRASKALNRPSCAVKCASFQPCEWFLNAELKHDDHSGPGWTIRAMHNHSQWRHGAPQLGAIHTRNKAKACVVKLSVWWESSGWSFIRVGRDLIIYGWWWLTKIIYCSDHYQYCGKMMVGTWTTSLWCLPSRKQTWHYGGKR